MTTGPNLGGLLETLDRHGVHYVVAGTVGALAHGATVTPLGRRDVVPKVAVTFAELRPRAALLRIAGREACVAHPLDLLAGMTAARRPKDRARVRHLRSLASDMIGPRSGGSA